jgi:recombination protein U
MVNYPNKKTTKTQETLYGNRGMSFEKELNESNKYYKANNIALIHKKPTPLQIVKVDYPKRAKAVIKEAYFQSPSTTDYNGIYRGKYIDFEAKETNSKTSFPIQNIHVHQIEHIKQVIDLGGIAFILIKFSTFDKTFLLDGNLLYEFYQNSLKGGKKSLSIKFLLEKAHMIEKRIIFSVDYLNTVNQVYFNA